MSHQFLIGVQKDDESLSYGGGMGLCKFNTFFRIFHSQYYSLFQEKIKASLS